MNYKSKTGLLLVEDDDVHAEALLRALQKTGSSVAVTRAANGLEALQILREQHTPRARLGGKPFVVLLDLKMPRQGGLEFLKDLRQDPELHGAVVFVLTTSDRREDIEASYAQGVAGYFSKPSSGEGYAQIAKLITQYAELSILPAI